MKLPSKICAAGLLLSLVGCATAPLEHYPAIPEYPRDKTYDTSARCFVPNTLGLEQLSAALTDGLKKAGFTVYGNEAFDQKKPVPPDFIVEPSYWRGSLGKHNGETIVYVQVIVRVRRPAVLSENREWALFGEKPRDFQAISRHSIGTRPIAQEDYTRGIADAIDNMMYNPEFRKALQSKPRVDKDMQYGINMTVQEVPGDKKKPARR